MVVDQFWGCFGLSFKVLLGYGFGEFLYKGNVGVLGEMLLKFPKLIFLFWP